MNKINQLFFIVPCLLALSACNIDGDKETTSSSERFLYTSSNATGSSATDGNRIIQLNINSDGSLREVDQDASVAGVQALSTGGRGDSADGDFDGQESLHVIGDYLLAVNAGDNFSGNGSVSVFSINTSTGVLTRVDQNTLTDAVDNIDSGGIRPVSISSVVRGGVTWVLVANQHSNPHYGASRTNILDSNAAAATIESGNERNIHAFTFSGGVLTAIGTNPVATYNSGAWGGPSMVAFSPDGNKVAVTTWGIPQFGEGITTLNTVQNPSRVYFYDVNYTAATPALTLTPTSIFQKAGISGSIGLSWGMNNNRVFVANFNLDATTDAGNGVTVLNANTATGTNTFSMVVSSAGTGDTTNGNEVCWTWLSRDNTRLYTASFATNKVTYFDVNETTGQRDQLEFNQSRTRSVQTSLADTKDIFIPRNGNTLYVSGAFRTHTMSFFDIDSDGRLAEDNNSPYMVPSALGVDSGANVTNPAQAFLGLVGY